MEFISSDTNVWIDFSVINELNLPFLLPYTYIMNEDAVEDELLSPGELKEQLLENGLVSISITADELFEAQRINSKYIQLSIYDSVALAIAKIRNIVLLTGDLALRKAAIKEGVKIKGSIGILDELYSRNSIDKQKYLDCLEKMKEHNHSDIRLPDRELDIRIANLKALG